MAKIQSFTDLDAWKQGHQLVLFIYRATATFPKTEQYSLVDQLRRCAISITSNIAEGFSRRSSKEKQQFFYMALGSLTELQNQLLVANDIGYLDKDSFQSLATHSVGVSKLINGLIKFLKNT